MKNNNANSNPLLHAILPVVIALLYLVLGFTVDSGWKIGWLLFLLIPIIESLVTAVKTKKASEFSYAVLAAGVFVFTGLMWGLWHPMWVVFLTIPAYSAICEHIENKKAQNNPPVEYQPPNQQGYYQQPVNPQYQQPNKSNSTAIIITIIISVAAVAIVGIVSVFSWLNGNIKVHGIFDDFGSSMSESVEDGPFDIATEGISKLEVNWINGNIDVSTYDGDTIYVEELGSNIKHPMSYELEHGTLVINAFRNKEKVGISGKDNKDVVIKLPKDMNLDELDFDTVSANINATDIKTDDLELETVSGDSRIELASQPRDISVDSVSGNVQLAFDESFSGYSLEEGSLSGSVSTSDFGNADKYGDGYTRITFDSVSGNLVLKKGINNK